MYDFEYSVKRSFDPEKDPDGYESFVVYGLTKDLSKGFGDSMLYIPRFVHILADQPQAILTWSLSYGSHADLSHQKESSGVFRPQLEGNKQTYPKANKCRRRKRSHGFGKYDLILGIPI